MIAFILRRAGERGTSFAFDALSVCLWLLSFAVSLAILRFFSEKRAASVNPAWKEFCKAKKRRAARTRAKARR